jgi:hypothetical protein
MFHLKNKIMNDMSFDDSLKWAEEQLSPTDDKSNYMVLVIVGIIIFLIIILIWWSYSSNGENTSEDKKVTEDIESGKITDQMKDSKNSSLAQPKQITISAIPDANTPFQK